MKRAAMLVVLASIATGCPRARVVVEPTGTATPRPPSTEILGLNITILPGTESALRFGFTAAEPNVRAIVTFPDSGSIVAVCALPAEDATIPAEPASPGCRREIPSGVREELSLSSSALAGVALWVRSGPAVVASVRLEYGQVPGARRVSITMPLIPPPPGASVCRDNGCNPVFEVLPVKGGAFAASAAWAGGTGRLALLQGRVIAKSFTATGVPYGVPAQQQGEGKASIATRLSAPGEFALVLDGNRTALTNIRIESSWP